MYWNFGLCGQVDAKETEAQYIYTGVASLSYTQVDILYNKDNI